MGGNDRCRGPIVSSRNRQRGLDLSVGDDAAWFACSVGSAITSLPEPQTFYQRKITGGEGRAKSVISVFGPNPGFKLYHFKAHGGCDQEQRAAGRGRYPKQRGSTRPHAAAEQRLEGLSRLIIVPAMPKAPPPRELAYRDTLVLLFKGTFLKQAANARKFDPKHGLSRLLAIEPRTELVRSTQSLPTRMM
jgi:hypothetical protein